MKTLTKLITAGALTCALSLGSAKAAIPSTITVAGETLSGVHTFLLNDRTYVPLGDIVELLEPSAALSWKNGTATVTSDVLTLTATVGDKWIEANGRCFYLPDGVILKNGRVMVHIRALVSAMGGSLVWDQAADSVEVTAGKGSPDAPSYSADDLYWLSRIISAESQGEPFEGKLAVGTVVLNRVASDQFPNNIYDVIFDRKYGVQFTPTSNGAIYWEPTEESVIAAMLCLEGARVGGNSLYFLDPVKSSSHWVMENRDYVTTIGCHWFYA